MYQNQRINRVQQFTTTLYCIAILLINSVSVSAHAHEIVRDAITGTEVQAILNFMEIAATPAKAVKVIEPVTIAVDPREVLTRYGCQGCHQVQGAGGTLGPSLDSVISDRGKAFFLRKVKEPQFNNASSAMPQMPITDEELEVLAEFLSPK